MAESSGCHQLAIPDNLVPPVNIRLAVYLPIKPSVTQDEVYSVIRQGLHKTMHQIPLLSWKVFLRSPTSSNWIPGQQELRHDDSWNPPADPQVDPRQLHRKDLSKQIGYSYKELKELGFPCNLFDEDILVEIPLIPNIAAGTDVFKAQVNFVEGGCILGAVFYHPVADAFGMTLIMQVWAAHCKALSSLEVSWRTEEIAQRLQSKSWDRGIIDEVFDEHDDGPIALEHLTTTAWTMIGLERDLQQRCINIQPVDRFLKHLRFRTLNALPILFNFLYINESFEWWQSMKTAVYSTIVSALHPPKAWSDRKDQDTLVTGDLLTSNESGQQEDGERPKVQASCFFYISHIQFNQLKKDLKAADPLDKSMISGNDAIMALFWRSCLRARINARHAKTYPPDQISLLQCPTDTRGVYSSNLTTNYTGNLLVLKVVSCPLYKLISEETPLQEIAALVRQSSSTITKENIHQSIIVAREIKDFTALNFAYTRIEGTAMLITSLAAFPSDQFNVGDGVFGNGGRVERLRPLMSKSNAIHRTCVILPKLPQGGLEVSVSLFPDELDALLEDEEFSRYATFICN